MSPFVRFIFVVLIAGIVVNLTIVVLANTGSVRRQAQAVERERTGFEDLLEQINGRLRRMEIAVEWQKMGAKDEVLETALLVRQYRSMSEDPKDRLPVQRVTLPGGRIYVDGMMMEFDSLFAGDQPELQLLRGANVWHFWHIYGEGEKKAEWQNLLPEGQVPEVSRLNPEKPFPGYYEMQVWRYLWELIEHPEQAAKAGLKVKELRPAARAVRYGRVYTAFVGLEGVSLEEASSLGRFEEMRQEARQLEERGLLKDRRKETVERP